MKEEKFFAVIGDYKHSSKLVLVRLANATTQPRLIITSLCGNYVELKGIYLVKLVTICYFKHK